MAMRGKAKLKRTIETEQRPLLQSQGERKGSIWQSRSLPFVNSLIAGFIISLFTLTACTAGSHASLPAISDIQVGSTTETLVGALGKPYAIHKLNDGSLEYEYIERFKAGGRNVEQRRYFIQVRDGIVVSKRVEQSTSWPYYLDSYDSYEMQTTQNGP